MSYSKFINGLDSSWKIQYNCDEMIPNIQKELFNYVDRNNLQSLVIGISGGVDSALCAVIAKPVCDKLEIPLIGISIPIESNKLEELTRADEIGKYYCDLYWKINLTDLYQELSIVYEPGTMVEETEEEEKIRMGNIKARMRMIYLYNVAQYTKGMVLSTDNYTEYLLGFWTLHGDVGDYGMIQQLWKTEVYALAEYLVSLLPKGSRRALALASCIDAVPTDGLGITNSDLDQLGVKTYKEVDECLQHLCVKTSSVKDFSELPIGYTNIVKRHLNSNFKRNNPFNIERNDISTSNANDSITEEKDGMA
jgi:NAD+ synthase